MSRVRLPAVAGRFYPGNPDTLRAAVHRYLREAGLPAEGPDAAGADATENGAGAAGPGPPAVPKILIAPHAGYAFSAPVAASGYVRLGPLRSRIRRVVLVGPSHYVPFRGLGLSSAHGFETPLGCVPVDREAAAGLRVPVLDEAHLQEHSLEVHLPFLQELLGPFSIVPLVAGGAPAEEVADVLEAVYGGPETLILISSDLSHYHDYDTARRLDRETTRAIAALRPEQLGEESACGRIPVRGALVTARRHGLTASTYDLRSSGDTGGPRHAVVGYGAYGLG